MSPAVAVAKTSWVLLGADDRRKHPKGVATRH